MPFRPVHLHVPGKAFDFHPPTRGAPQSILAEMPAHLIAENLVLSALHPPRGKVHDRSHYGVLAVRFAAADPAERMAGSHPDSVFDELLHGPADLQPCEIGAHRLAFPDHGWQSEARYQGEAVQILSSADQRPS